MSDKQIYTAYILDQTELGTQLLRIAFEYRIIDFWAEKEAQDELKNYFRENHFTKETPVVVEASELFDFMALKG